MPMHGLDHHRGGEPPGGVWGLGEYPWGKIQPAIPFRRIAADVPPRKGAAGPATAAPACGPPTILPRRLARLNVATILPPHRTGSTAVLRRDLSDLAPFHLSLEHWRCPAPVVHACSGQRRYGGMAEWLKAHAWKACLRETVTWVRIPLPPPRSLCVHVRRRSDESINATYGRLKTKIHQ